jgi:pimeloyl-ACP methyl ester carboxylesterase
VEDQIVQEKRIVINGLEWTYVTGGQGERAMLLFHGFVGGGDSMHWLTDVFKDRYRIIAPTIANTRSLNTLCSAVSAILDEENVGKAIVFGGSFGGTMAQAFFSRYKNRVEDLILLSTGAPDRKRGVISEMFTWLFAPFPFSLMRKLMKMELSKRLIAAETPDIAEGVRSFKARMIDRLDHQMTREIFMSRMRLLVEFTKKEAYKPEDCAEWRGRILIIESADDPMINEKERKRLKATYPEAEVYTFEGAGHLIPLLKLDEMIDVIRDFLREDRISGAV